MNTLILTKQDIQHIVTKIGIDELMGTLIELLDKAFAEYDPDITVVPIRDGFSYDTPHPGLVEWMPVMSAKDSAILKLVGYHPNNPIAHELPTIISTLSVYDLGTGHLSGLMDATFLTALRTGAASAVASRYLAQSEASVVGIIGAGAQAVTQLHALSKVMEVKQVLTYDLNPYVVKSYIERTSFMNIRIKEVEKESLPDLVSQADVLCTATSNEIGSGPVFFDSEDIKPWLHINAIGSDFPGKVEVPLSLLRRAFVSPDFRDQARKEGECQQLEDHEIGPALHEIVKQPEKFESKRDELTVFDSTGWAIEDMVAARMMLDYAQDLALGQPIEIEHISTDPLDPYDFSS